MKKWTLEEFDDPPQKDKDTSIATTFFLYDQSEDTKN